MMMLNLSSTKDLISFVQSNYGMLIVALFSLAAPFVLSKALRKRVKINNSPRDHQAGIPGRLGLPFVGETLSFLSATNSTQGCYDFVRTRRSRYGKCFKTKLFAKVHVFVPSTEGARKIFTSEFAEFSKGYIKPMADAVGTKSLLCVPQESHRRIRRLLSDPFAMPSLQNYVKKFDRILSQRLKELEASGKSFKVLDFGMKITLDGMCNMLLSITDESRLREIERDLTAISDAMLSIPLMIPGTAYYKGMKARQRLIETFKRIIERRRSGKESHEDFLQSMLERDSFPPSEKLDDVELMDNLLTMLIAGQTTTAAAMMWSVKFLDENRETQDMLREEQLRIAINKKDRTLLALEDLNNMSYGLKVVKETLRMANVLLWLPRKALNDCSIDGYEIKKGWHVDIDATCIHFDPDLYKDPTRFNPSRFDEMQKPYSFIAFGSGSRTCLGMNMAKVTMLVFLHRLTSGYRWTVDDMDPSLEKKAHIPRLRTGCPITLKAIE